MTIDIVPDPQRPHGGGAILRLPADAQVADEATVSIYDRSRQRWLGDKAWQPSQERFGPYQVQVATDGTKEIAVGSEIVDYIEEYSPLSVHVGALSADLDWPDTILYAPGSPPRSGILGADEPEPSRLTGTTRLPPSSRENAEPPESEVEPGNGDHDATDVVQGHEEADGPDVPAPANPLAEREEQAAGRKWIPYVLAGIAVVAATVALAVFLLQSEPVTPPFAENGTDAAPPVLTADRCEPAALAGLGAEFAEAVARLRECGDVIGPDAALAMLERGAAARDPDALMAFGQLYDTAAADPLLEEQIGLAFEDRPDVAARYYSQARDAGNGAGAAALEAICERIETLSDALIVETAAEYCE